MCLSEALEAYAQARLSALRSGRQAEQLIGNVFAGILETLQNDLSTKRVVASIEERRRTAPATADLSWC